MELWIVIALLIAALTLLALVRQVRFARALHRLLVRLLKHLRTLSSPSLA